MSVEEARSWQVEVYHSAVAEGARSKFKSGHLCTAVCKRLHVCSRLIHLVRASMQQRCRRNRRASDPMAREAGMLSADRRHRGMECRAYVLAHGAAVTSLILEISSAQNGTGIRPGSYADAKPELGAGPMQL